jgi:hypothetical protein
MAYTPPDQVISPKSQVSGPIVVLYDEGEGGFAIASLFWDSNPAIGMRWNGSINHPGNPQSRGVPVWFILDDRFVEAILKEILRVGPKDKQAEHFIRRWLGDTDINSDDFEERFLNTYKKLKNSGLINLS